ncbi:MAG: MFS transporter [Candidatus Heimdallarchaeota archaeon]|nr:MAG: MFS transporter [Candidatus Heimdallarchaeota archaeon]
MLTYKEKVSYGIGRLGSSITMDMADLFTGYVYYAFFGLEENAFLAFLGVAFGKIVIAFTSYFSGYISDRTQTRWGRRRPFVILGAPLLAIAFFFLYSPHIILPFLGFQYETMVIFSYLIIVNSIYQGTYGLLLTPFQSWMPEITTEDERLEISGYQNTVNLIAFVIGAGFAFLLPGLLGGSAEELDLDRANEVFTGLTNKDVLTTILPFIIGVFALLVIIFFIPSIIGIKAKEVFIPQPTIREELNVVFDNKNYISWTLARGFISVALSMIMGIVLTWIDKALYFTGVIEYLLFGVTLLGVVFSGFIFWARFGNRHGKTKSYIYSAVWMAVWIPFTLIVGQIEMISQIIPILLQAIIFVIFAGIGVSGFYLLPYAIVADIVEEDERRTGESRAGMYYGFESIPLNFFQVFGFLIVGYLLQENFPFNIPTLPLFTDWQGHTYSLGLIIWGPIAAIFILISVIVFWKFVNADPLKKS